MIYVLGLGRTGYIKVGYSRNHDTIARRIKSLQTGSALPLKLLHVEEGKRTDETILHKRLAEYRCAREWFYLDTYIGKFARVMKRDGIGKAIDALSNVGEIDNILQQQERAEKRYRELLDRRKAR